MILDALLAAPDDNPAGRVALRLSILDWTACALAGVIEPVARAVRTLHEPGAVPLLGGGTSTPSRAAMINATTGHALDYDDTHFDHIGHVSTVVLPAALAVAPNWEAFEAAALAGAEAAIRIGVWLGREHYSAGFHQTATSGAFGATLACARLLGLTRDQTVHALGLCASRAAGLKSQFGTDGKPLNAGLAAATGVECAQLAAAGATSSALALDGPQGFGASHAGQGGTPPTGPRFHAVSHKLHACCHGLHAALEALRLHPDPRAGVITVATHPRWMSVCNQVAPTTGLGAKFSYRTALALAALGHDTADPATFSDALACAPEIVALRDQVTVLADPSLADTAAKVAVGKTTTTFDIATPSETETLRERLTSKARHLIGSRTRDVAAAIEAKDLKTYFAAVTAPISKSNA